MNKFFEEKTLRKTTETIILKNGQRVLSVFVDHTQYFQSSGKFIIGGAQVMLA